MAADRLLNIREAAEYLDIGERALKEMVDAGDLPAYRIGGAFLRFKKSQLAVIKADRHNSKRKASAKTISPSSGNDRADAIKDFLYYNDFYILSAVIITIAVILMVTT